MQQQDSSMSAVSGVHIWLVLMKAFHSLSAYSSRDWRESGLGDSEFRVLEVLLHKGPLPVNVIGPKVYLTPGSISLAVDRLYAKGFVSRIESETDRRVRLIDLTPKGRTLIQGIFNAHARSMEELVQVLNETERIHLVEALKKLGKHAAESVSSEQGF
jgi:MarR family transcriptional regulator, 2-MHQ and catechol-resistance regulon repressor